MKNEYREPHKDYLDKKEKIHPPTYNSKIRQPDDYRLAGPSALRSSESQDISTPGVTTTAAIGIITAATFQNVTNINSTLIFCRASADEFNYSTNPTFTDSNGRIRVVDQGQEDTQRTFSFPTTVGLHDEFGNLLAVAKMSRPIEKNDEKDITFRIRLDF